MQSLFTTVVLCALLNFAYSSNSSKDTLKAPAKGCAEIVHTVNGEVYRAYACDGEEGPCIVTNVEACPKEAGILDFPDYEVTVNIDARNHLFRFYNNYLIGSACFLAMIPQCCSNPAPPKTPQPPEGIGNCAQLSTPWRRLLYINMSDPQQYCPAGFREIPVYLSPGQQRLCGRGDTGNSAGCLTLFSSYNQEPFTQVAGRITGYQYGYPYAFYYSQYGGQNIDSYYVDGFSVTQGYQGSRQHIWTFAAGPGEKQTTYYTCPCTYGSSTKSPSFVGSDYFCDTANHVSNEAYSTPFYSHPLWDGQNCVGGCCHYNNPPWFCKQLPYTSNNNLEIRHCLSQAASSSDVQFSLIELYVR